MGVQNPELCGFVIFGGAIWDCYCVEWVGLVEYIGSILIRGELKCLAYRNPEMES